jgi:hypothetical protein
MEERKTRYLIFMKRVKSKGLDRVSLHKSLVESRALKMIWHVRQNKIKMINSLQKMKAFLVFFAYNHRTRKVVAIR